MRSWCAGTAFVVGLAIGASAQNYDEPPPELSTLPAGSLFETWRPEIHVLPPDGIVGDPCGHYNDPETGIFHVGFLHNGTGMAAVETADLVFYYDVNENGNYTLVPGGPNDPVAVFDGSVIPSGIGNKPTLLYTSVSSLPIHWTLPYTRGSESQSLAVTYDGGHNFSKLAIPPVIPEPPSGLNVTAFRDPYVFQSGILDRTLEGAEGTWYATISGGQHDIGPGIFLYRNQGEDFENWEYLGEWWEEPANSTWGNGDWAKLFGYNFETGNVFSLDEEGYNLDGDTFLTFGVEGAYAPIQAGVTSMHAMLWAAGNISKADGGNVTFIPNMVGVLDWGLSSYAAAGKVLPRTSQASSTSGAPDRFISYIWLTGNRFGADTDFPDAQQEWQHTLLLPRELSVKTISNVVNNELVQEIGSWRVSQSSDNSTTHGSISGGDQNCVQLETLGIDIARETYQAISSKSTFFTESGRTLNSSSIIPFQRSPTTRFFALTAQVSFQHSARQSALQSGFQILSSDLEFTTVYYQFSNESIVVDRSNTSAAAQTTSGIDSSSESGRLRLFDVQAHCNQDYDGDGGKDDHGHEGKQIESLDLTIVLDNSVLEVFANSRFGVSTWVRPWYSNSTEIRFFQNGDGEVTFSDINVYDGLYDAYPDRDR